jgi:multidrug efflux system membrane fusion protein
MTPLAMIIGMEPVALGLGQVAVVGTDHPVTLKNITTGRDFGNSLEVVSGLSPDDDVIVNPSDSMATGMQVRVLQPPPAPTSRPQS